jgi:hypothetical protein
MAQRIHLDGVVSADVDGPQECYISGHSSIPLSKPPNDHISGRVGIDSIC